MSTRTKSKKIQGAGKPAVKPPKPPRTVPHDVLAVTAALYAMDPATLTPLERSNLWNAAGVFIGRCKEKPGGQ
jgi:hypothetical protein